MDDLKFKTLLAAVGAKDRTEVWGAEVKEILTELLSGEFAGVKETKFKIMLERPKGGGAGGINKVDGRVRLWINPEGWNDPGFVRDGSLRDLIRHELLHLETGLDDEDPLFKLEAKRRGIGLWRRLQGV